jgi:hypothetical protein
VCEEAELCGYGLGRDGIGWVVSLQEHGVWMVYSICTRRLRHDLLHRCRWIELFAIGMIDVR